ncbi:uncharacterized protein N7506_007584 [Penicillium brevicompactum]|uniref:uncharacterized protein n=1 Tax=Penicillium brevicompactum TaxID=5074 RepID=UPI002541A777|nr:uncharacterized protein N7506_007584 [Penicillium brevicompactum]KAJ5333801.1 hypothetical protein N7506_007584 [Penicillium brevicompactum]
MSFRACMPSQAVRPFRPSTTINADNTTITEFDTAVQIMGVVVLKYEHGGTTKDREQHYQFAGHQAGTSHDFQGGNRGYLPNFPQSTDLAPPDRSPAAKSSHWGLSNPAISPLQSISVANNVLWLLNSVSILATAANVALSYFKDLISTAESITPDPHFLWYLSATFTTPPAI